MPKHVVYLLTPYTVIKCCVLTHPPDFILIFDIVIAHNGDEPLKDCILSVTYMFYVGEDVYHQSATSDERPIMNCVVRKGKGKGKGNSVTRYTGTDGEWKYNSKLGAR